MQKLALKWPFQGEDWGECDEKCLKSLPGEFEQLNSVDIGKVR